MQFAQGSASMSHPSSDFYWADWENEPTLRVCSFAAQGVWMRICARCHHSPERGRFLMPSGVAPTPQEYAELFGKGWDEIAPLVEELVAKRVCDRGADGVLVNRRMLKEEERRARKKARADGGENWRGLAESNLNGACREVEKRALAKERQRRRRAKLRSQNERDTSRDECVTVTQSHVTVTRDSVTNRVTVTRDSVTACVTPPEEKQALDGEVTNIAPTRTRAGASSFLLPPSESNPERERAGPGVADAGPPATLTGGGPAPQAERQPEQDRATALIRASRRQQRRLTPPAPEEDADERNAKLEAERERLRRAFENEAAA
jgi:hypothetical protein